MFGIFITSGEMIQCDFPKNMFNFIGKNIKHKLWPYRSSSVCSLLAIIGSTWQGNLDQSSGDVRGFR